MDINQLTIGQAKELAALFGGQAAVAHAVNPIIASMIGTKVIVRASAAGVMYGELVSLEGTTVKLKNTRRLWYWVVKDKKGISLSDVAEHGLDNESKVCASVPSHIILDVAEIMATSEAAQSSIENADVYTRS